MNVKTKAYELYFGDCLEVMGQLPEKSVNLVLTDPPYGTTRNSWDTKIPFDEMWAALDRILAENSVLVFTAQQPFTSELICSRKPLFKQTLVWSKNKASGHLNARRRHLTAHEDIVIFGTGRGVYNPQKSKGHRPSNFANRTSESSCYNTAKALPFAGGETERFPRTILNFPVCNNDGSGATDRRYHPTQKPVALIQYLIDSFSNPGDSILDFCMGSGTAGVGCAFSGRRFTGIENDPASWGVACQRVADAYNSVDASVSSDYSAGRTTEESDNE